AAATLGRYSLLAEAEIQALESALGDPDDAVRRAAEAALRRLGVRPTVQPLPHPPRPARPTQAAGMTPPRHAWLPLLERWSQQWLRNQEYAVELPDTIIQSGWLGFTGASEEELAATEHRLGQPLPPSYREFLRLTNGWRRTTSYIE